MNKQKAKSKANLKGKKAAAKRMGGKNANKKDWFGERPINMRGGIR